MKEKLKNDKFATELLYKFLAVLMVASVALLMFNVLSEGKDGRRQIVDDNGGTEYVFNGKHEEPSAAVSVQCPAGDKHDLRRNRRCAAEYNASGGTAETHQ